MSRPFVLATVLVVGTLLCYEAYASRGVVPDEVSDGDVHRFADALDRLTPADSTCAALGSYFSGASRGLRAYESKLHLTPRGLCIAVHRSPARYASIRSKLAGVDAAVAGVDSIFARFHAIYPEGRQPGVYFVVGAGMAAGTTTHGSDPVVLIGIERNEDPSRIASVVAHEFVHTQQDYPWIGILTGGPSFLRGTLLRQSIMEGSANLIAELVTGSPYRDAYAEAHEAELWREFSAEMHGKDYGHWLWNGGNRQRGDRPADLGYWVGYRITKAYYDRAADKSRAIHDILHIRDFDRFLAESGYGGAQTY